MNRHFKCSIVVSSQYYQHLVKDGRTNIDYFIIFGNMPIQKLQVMYEEAELNVTFDDFLNMYMKATAKPYSFFWIDRKRSEFRINFSEEIEVN